MDRGGGGYPKAETTPISLIQKNKPVEATPISLIPDLIIYLRWPPEIAHTGQLAPAQRLARPSGVAARRPRTDLAPPLLLFDVFFEWYILFLLSEQSFQIDRQESVLQYAWETL